MATRQKHLRIDSAEVHDIVGHASTWGDVTFVPVLAEIDGAPKHLAHWLSDFADNLATPFDGDDELGIEDASALYVRAVMPAVFGFAPPHVADGHWSLLDTTFAAIIDSDEQVHLFVLTDCELEAGIMFPENSVEDLVQDRIVKAFWSLLTEFRGELHEFDADGISWCHPDGYDADIRVGLNNKVFYASNMIEPSD